MIQCLSMLPMLSDYLHTLNPVIVDLFMGLSIRWYGLSYVAGFVIAWFVVLQLSNKHLTLMTPKDVADFTVFGAIGVVVGGRLGYIIFYSPELLFEFNNSFPFWGMLAMNKGGMASHGGMVGMALACVFFQWRRKIPLLHLMDMIVIATPIGVFFGRLANFINGELLGRPLPKDHDLPWAVRFPQEIPEWVGDPDHVQGLQDYYSVLEKYPEKSIVISQESWNASVQAAAQGDEFAQGFVAKTISDTLQRTIDNPVMHNVLHDILPARHPSQLYAAGLEGLLLLAILWIVWFKPRKPGVLAAWCIMTYAVVRIFGEYFRRPDLHIGFQLWGLTRGQWLSVAMLGIGLSFFVWVCLRKTERIGGWGPSRVHVDQPNDTEAEAEEADEDQQPAKKKKA